jgi:uncharacterized membrane protein
MRTETANETRDGHTIDLESDTAVSTQIHAEERRNRKNIGVLEGRISAAVGGALLLVAGIWRKRRGLGLASVGGYLLYRGLSRRDPIYRLFGWNTETQGDQGRVEVARMIVIERPVSEVYGYWRDLEQLPRFMRHLVSVRELDSQRSHWAANAPAGTTVEWDAEIVQDLPNRRLSWRSLPGSEVMNSGVVHFRALPDDATEVRVFLAYAPQAGVVGATIARLPGEAPGMQIEDDLERLKDLLESTDQSSAAPGTDQLAAAVADDTVDEIDSATHS